MFFNHNLGFRVKDFMRFENLKYQYKITMTFKDKNFGDSVAAIEHKYYPIYAL